MEAVSRALTNCLGARGSGEAGQAVEDWLKAERESVRRRTRRVKVPRLAVIPLREGCRLGGNHSAR